jgi:hypothetical protein
MIRDGIFGTGFEYDRSDSDKTALFSLQKWTKMAVILAPAPKTIGISVLRIAPRFLESVNSKERMLCA